MRLTRCAGNLAGMRRKFSGLSQWRRVRESISVDFQLALRAVASSLHTFSQFPPNPVTKCGTHGECFLAPGQSGESREEAGA
jgi:hypothetical protein